MHSGASFERLHSGSSSHGRANSHTPLVRREEARINNGLSNGAAEVSIRQSHPSALRRFDSMSSDSETEAPLGSSPTQNEQIHRQIIPSRWPSAATDSNETGGKSRAMSASSTSSEYGTSGYYGWGRDPSLRASGGLTQRPTQSPERYAQRR